MAQASADRPIAPAGRLHIFTDHRLDELFAAYENNGVDIMAPPQNFPWGMREFAIRDLYGYMLRFGRHL